MNTHTQIPNVSTEELQGYVSPQNDNKKIGALKAGHLIHFEPSSGPLDSEQRRTDDRARRTIQAAWLNDLATGLDRVVSTPIKVNNCIIEGLLDLRYATFKCEVSITNSEFAGEVDFSFATFDRTATFNGSQFLNSAAFRATHAKGDLEFALTRFSDCPDSDELHAEPVFRTDFQDLKVDYVFRANGACFGCTNFQRAVFSKSVLFRPGIIANALEAQDEPHPVRFTGEVDFSDAHIAGPAFFNGADFERKAVFSRIHIGSIADFGCYLEGEYFIRTRFRDETRFVGAKFDSSAIFRGVHFEGDLFFHGTEIGGGLHFYYVELDETKIKFERRRDPGGDSRSIAALAPQFIPVRFCKSARFISMRVRSSAYFIGAEFQGDATFELMHVEGHALFRSFFKNNVYARTTFGGQANFLRAQVRGNAEFDGASFRGAAVFELAELSNVLFRPYKLGANGEAGLLQCCFWGKTNFLGMKIEGEAHFSGVSFKDEVSFEGMHVHGKADFDSFIHEQEINPADYKECDPVSFNRLATFSNSHFKHDVTFERARFLERADFTRATADGEASFRGAEFHGDLVLNNARFVAVLFGEFSPHSRALPHAPDTQPDQISNAIGSPDAAKRSAKIMIRQLPKRIQTFASVVRKRQAESKREPQLQFYGNLDLRGFVYDRIEVNLDELLKDRIHPYDRHPYAQLERVYRMISDEYSTDKIYVSLRTRQRQQIKERIAKNFRHLKFWPAVRGAPSWLLDYLHWRFTGYGTLPLRLLIVSVLFLAFGTAIFAQRGAVQYRDKIDELVLSRPDSIGAWGAFGLSLNQFIPIIDIPSGAKWKPSDQLIPYINPIPKVGSHITYATYGTIHRLAGGVLVPTGLAVLTLTLYRRGKAKD